MQGSLYDQQHQRTCCVIALQRGHGTAERLESCLPARSTRLSAPLRWVPVASWRPVMASMNTEWEREELAFMAVASHARATAAFFTSAAATSEEVTGVTVAPTTWVCPPAQQVAHSLQLVHDETSKAIARSRLGNVGNASSSA